MARRWELKHRQRVFLGRFFTGLEVGRSRCETFGWFCLTESDEALSAGLDWRKASNVFFSDLRHRCPGIQYAWVEHRQGVPSKVTGLQRRNVHVFWRWREAVPALFVAETWQRLYKSSCRRIQVLPEARLKRAGCYLAYDLVGRGPGHDLEKFVKARFSHGWVFDGSVGHYESRRRATGDKPEVGYLVSLANLPPAELDLELSADGRGFKRVDRKLEQDRVRILRGTWQGPYLDPEYLQEHWGCM